jgi:hypothetical protein
MRVAGKELQEPEDSYGGANAEIGDVWTCASAFRVLLQGFVSVIKGSTSTCAKLVIAGIVRA